MGGHGGLNILPQKSWNVYNFDNRERVRKDEEEAAQKAAIEQQKARQRDAEYRLEKMREIAQAKSRSAGIRGVEETAIEGDREERLLGSSSSAEQPQHVNLFVGCELVESREQGRASGKDRRGDARDGREKEGRSKKGETKSVVANDEHYRLGYGALGNNGKKPWYSSKRFMLDRDPGEGGLHTQDARPTSEKKPEKRRKTMEDLRAERLKREQQERDKARRLVVAQRRAAGYGPDRPGRPYYNQSFGNACKMV